MLKFTKYQGLGNDFLVMDVADADAVSPASLVPLCDRHFGVGGDGVILVAPGAPGEAAKMKVVNADGSVPEMCGNGLRCVALHLSLREAQGREAQGREAQSAQGTYVVGTGAGRLTCKVERRGTTAQVTVNMGRATELGSHRTCYQGISTELLRISTGNPHAILFDSELSNAEIDVFGSQVSGELAGGANVEFVRPAKEPGVLDVVVWERGVGRTLACGTGACATVVAAVGVGRAAYGEPVRVRLPGGELEIVVERGSLEMQMTGPAQLVFDGSVAL